MDFFFFFSQLLTSDMDISSYTYFVNTECFLYIMMHWTAGAESFELGMSYRKKNYVYIDVLIDGFKLVFIHGNVYWSHCI